MKLKKYTYLLFGIIYQLISLLMPKFKNKIIFISYPDASDNSWHLYRYIVNNLSDYNLIWLCSNGTQVKQRILDVNKSELNNKVRVYNKFSLYGILHFFTAAYVFHTHGTYFFVKKSKRVKVINLWHGMPIKAIGYLDGKNKYEVAYGDYLLSTSDYFSPFMAEAFGIQKENVLPFGLPRNDVLMISNKELNDQVYQILNVPRSNKIIFWLPTFRTSIIGDVRCDSTSQSFLDDWDEIFFDLLNKIADEKKVTLIIKIHPMDKLNNETLISRDNIRIIKSQEWQKLGIDLYDALSCSSGLISDVSSVLLDYICSDKIIGITKSNKHQYTRTTLFGLDGLSKECFSIIQPDDLIQFIKKIDLISTNYSLIRKYNSSIKDSACYSIPAILNYFNIK